MTMKSRYFLSYIAGGCFIVAGILVLPSSLKSPDIWRSIFMIAAGILWILLAVRNKREFQKSGADISPTSS
jgi:hypothetical protein